MTTLVERAPRFSLDEAAALARRLYGLEARPSPLPSERDQNFHLAGDAGAFVLKIANGLEQEATLAFQHALLVHLAARDAVVVPRSVPTSDGRSLGEVDGPGGTRHFVRLLTFVPGLTLSQVAPHTPTLLRSLGDRLAALDLALADFSHPGMARELPWDLRALPAARALVDAIEDAGRQGAVRAFIDRFEAELRPRLTRLRAQVVHNDWNDHNVLVDRDAQGEWLAVTAIDFGDALHAPVVTDLAVALAYALMDKPHPLDAGGEVVAGYHARSPLTDGELDLLPELVRARLTLSVIMSAHQHRLAPGNDYLRVSEAQAWRLLEQLSAFPARFVTARWRHACGLEPVPGLTARRGQVEAALAAAAPLRLDPAPRQVGEKRLALDAGSPELLEPLGADLVPGALVPQLPGGGAYGVAPAGDARWLVEAVDAVHDAGGSEPATFAVGTSLFREGPFRVAAAVPAQVIEVRREAGRSAIALDLALGIDARLVVTVSGAGLRIPPDLDEGASQPAGDPLARVDAVAGDWARLDVTAAVDDLGWGAAAPILRAPGERALWREVNFDPARLFTWSADIGDRTGVADAAGGSLRERRQARLGPSLSLSYREPLTIVRGRGAYLYDAEGRAYLDCVNNVAHVGHSHPRVVEAAHRQMRVLNTNTRYLHDNLVRYAEALTATLPDGLSVCFFVNSGSEANDLALRLAAAHTGAAGVVVLEGAYHGNLTSLIAASPYKFDGPGGKGRPRQVQVVPMPDPYRGRHRAPEPDLGRRYAAYVDSALDRAEADGYRAGAFLAESILSCGGQIVLPAGYLAEAYRLVRARGGVVIADEVQVGFGRAGTHFWAFETQAVVPDIVTMGKPIGNGHPLGAVVTRPEIARSFANGMEYFNTFGGNPVSCAVGLEVLAVVRDEALQQRAARVGGELLAGLAALGARHEAVGDARGLGLFLGVELVADRQARTPDAALAREVAEGMKALGVLVTTDGPDHNVLKIKPPLVFAPRDAATLVARLDRVIGECLRGRGA
jgi:4-aminobutyrate aminotransferase-like enzyme/Ser/Thr protein kinase RdoA (MazF antagonist)